MVHVEGKGREHFVLAFLSGCHQFEFRTQHRECQTRPLHLKSYICFFALVSIICKTESTPSLLSLAASPDHVLSWDRSVQIETISGGVDRGGDRARGYESWGFILQFRRSGLDHGHTIDWYLYLLKYITFSFNWTKKNSTIFKLSRT